MNQAKVQQVLQEVKRHPFQSVAQIALTVGMSRSYVDMILRKMGYAVGWFPKNGTK